MKLLLVEGNAVQAERILSTLGVDASGVVRIAETPVASGAFVPRHEHTTTILLGFSTPTADKLRVLKRLWASDCAPACMLVTLPGSAGELLLAAVVAGASDGDWRPQGSRPLGARRVHIRNARTLSLERMMALERIVARDVQAARRFIGAVAPTPAARAGRADSALT